MKRKTIEKELLKVHTNFVKSINDENVKALVNENAIITGGCIASMLLGEEVNDYDMYFTNQETVHALAEYYVKEVVKLGTKMDQSLPSIKVEIREVENESDRVYIKVKSRGLIKFHPSKKYFKPGAHLPIFLTCNAITLTDKVQLITRFYGNPEEIHSNYDFEHCKSYWTSKDKKLVTSLNSAEALLARELIYTGSKYPLSSIIRCRKFIRRGWKITAGEMLKMCFQLGQLDLMDVNVLEDQLIGVDTTYFQMFIDRIREESKKDGFKLTSEYVVEIIDEIFNDINNDDDFEENEVSNGNLNVND